MPASFLFASVRHGSTLRFDPKRLAILGLSLGVAWASTGCAGFANESISQAAATPPDRVQGPVAQTSPAPSRPAGPDTEVASDPLPALPLTREVLFQVLAAEIAAQRGQLGTATATYLTLARNTKDPRLARRATELALADRSLERALAGARLWYEFAPSSALSRQTLEALFLANGNLTEVEPLLAARLAEARSSGALPQAYQQLQRTLVRAPDLAAALNLLQRLSRQDQSLPEARVAMGQLADAAKDFERAATEFRAALGLKPTDPTLAVQTAQAASKSAAGNAGAVQVLEDFLKANPKATEARFTYARVLSQLERPAEAQRQMQQALSEDPDNPAILYAMAQLARQLKQPEVARGHLERYVALPRTVQRDNIPAFLFLAQLAEEAGQIPKAIEWLEKVNRGEAFLPALVSRANLMAKQGRIEEARELLRSTNVATNRERAQLSSAEAQLLRTANRPAEAFEVLDQALERMPNNPELLYDHGMAAERLNKIDIMERSLRKLIELRPDHAHAYNALGYSLADRNLRLDEAFTLISKALQLLPNDGHILDSMGWVLYRQGKLEEAASFLQRAFDATPEAEVAAHLGEVLWKQGKSAQARAMWQRAQQLDPANETLRETLSRFRVSLQ